MIERRRQFLKLLEDKNIRATPKVIEGLLITPFPYSGTDSTSSRVKLPISYTRRYYAFKHGSEWRMVKRNKTNYYMISSPYDVTDRFIKTFVQTESFSAVFSVLFYWIKTLSQSIKLRIIDYVYTGLLQDYSRSKDYDLTIVISMQPLPEEEKVDLDKTLYLTVFK